MVSRSSRSFRGVEGIVIYQTVAARCLLWNSTSRTSSRDIIISYDPIQVINYVIHSFIVSLLLLLVLNLHINLGLL